jgi:hypothetical protein
MPKSEAKIQNEIRWFLQAYGWKVERMHGNAFQKGIPDLYVVHPKHGKKWVEIKKPKGYKFTNEQLRNFPEFEKFNDPIWIMVAATKQEYEKLFGPPNWRSYLKPRDLKLMEAL